MLDLIWQIILPGRMTRIQEPDLLMDHNSGSRGCKKFPGGPVVESFAFSGASPLESDVIQHKTKSSVLSGRWFPFPSNSSPKRLFRTKEVDAVSFSSSTSTTPVEEKPIIVVHNNNNIIIDMLDENSHWSSSTAHSPPGILPPPAVVPSSNQSGLINSTTKSSKISSSNSSSKNSPSKPVKQNKNNNSNKNKNNCNNSISSNSSSNCSIINNKQAINSRKSNCGPTTTTGSHISSSSTHYRSNGISDDDDSGERHLIIRYINCNERPTKKQLVTLALISVLCLAFLTILFTIFVGPTPAEITSAHFAQIGSSKNSKEESEFSETLISSDITSSLNKDDVGLDDSDSYDDADTTYYSSTTSSPGLDLKKVSKLSWDLLNSNQDASSRNSGSSNQDASPPRGSGNSNSGRNGLLSSSPLGSVSSGSDGEIILPSGMIYTSTGDSTDLIPSEHGENGVKGGSQNKKRSCCRTQKYTQIVKRDGCEPLTIGNKMCFGQCVSVWVPGLFASFPVCRPSKSTFKMVTLTCGKNRELRKRVRVEKVKRCSCMEIEPTAASL